MTKPTRGVSPSGLGVCACQVRRLETPRGGSATAAAGDTLRRWVRQHERDTGQREGLTTAEAQGIKELERENRELRKANEILELASAFFAQAELDRRLK